MDKHTKEPWAVEEIDNEGEYGSGDDTHSGFKSFAICDSQGRVLFDSLNRDVGLSEIHEDFHEDGVTAWDELAERDARRIVACVNACQGVTDEQFAGGWNAADLSAYAKNLEQQRDDLLVALKAIKTYADKIQPINGLEKRCLGELADAAIVKVTSPTCPHCKGTGDATGQGYLDCVHCDAAETKAKAQR